MGDEIMFNLEEKMYVEAGFDLFSSKKKRNGKIVFPILGQLYLKKDDNITYTNCYGEFTCTYDLSSKECSIQPACKYALLVQPEQTEIEATDEIIDYFETHLSQLAKQMEQDEFILQNVHNYLTA